MTTILVIIGRMLRNQFNCNYLKSQRLFLQISLHVRNLQKILKIFCKKSKPHSFSIIDIIDSEWRCYLSV